MMKWQGAVSKDPPGKGVLPGLPVLLGLPVFRQPTQLTGENRHTLSKCKTTIRHVLEYPESRRLFLKLTFANRTKILVSEAHCDWFPTAWTSKHCTHPYKLTIAKNPFFTHFWHIFRAFITLVTQTRSVHLTLWPCILLVRRGFYVAWPARLLWHSVFYWSYRRPSVS